MEKQTTTNNMGVIAYLTVIGLIIAFVSNQNEKNEFTAYHLRQSLGIALTGIALGIIGLVPFIGWIISILGTLAIIFLWVSGLLNAINRKEKPVPLLGQKYEEWFKNI